MNYQFCNLILLTGTNPLPNFVVAEYFLAQNKNLKNIFLIYSEETNNQRGTKNYCDTLKELLNSHHQNNLTFEFIHLSNISDASQIRRDLDARLLPLLNSPFSVHLNYTGGTKVMGTHIYRWLEEKARENNIKASFSYLDARTFQIVDDINGRITGDLRNEIGLSIQELISLHEFERKNKPSEEMELFEETVKNFKELIENDKLGEYFSGYKREIFINKKGNLIETKKEFLENIQKEKYKNFKAEGAFLKIIKSMPEDYRLFNDDGSFREPKSNDCLKQAVKFLDGKWLELYVFDVLKNNLTGQNIEIDRNWEIKKKQWSSPHQKFELDIILLKGYQLIGISCTTASQRHICKSKGFEIFLRTRQIGGKEARAVLITRLNESQRNELQEELEIDTEGKENILVLGEDDLKESVLINRIKDFIK
ncbi:Card1-like endonuclease domain-containing protein [Thermodesulfovibrio sp.]|uniref:Card1-like endonuclease domain-containing protein n=1 Tax=Thermodesulfovibrio sp. TaxID=2067987 RepID=UPI003C7C1F79